MSGQVETAIGRENNLSTGLERSNLQSHCQSAVL
jgi:hypothetical protein